MPVKNLLFVNLILLLLLGLGCAERPRSEMGRLQFDHREIGRGMGLTCNNCHERNRPQPVVVESKVFTHGDNKDCAVCHKPDMPWKQAFGAKHSPPPASCLQCHEKKRPVARFQVRHGNGKDCLKCHMIESTWARVFPFQHTKNLKTCMECHESKRPLAKNGTIHGKGQDCIECHFNQPEKWKKTKDFNHGQLFNRDPNHPMECNSCHEPKRPKLTLDPGPPRQKVPGHFESDDCASCHLTEGLVGNRWNFLHKNARVKGMTKCLACHETKTRQFHARENPEYFRGPETCVQCHCSKGENWRQKGFFNCPD